MNQIYLYVIDNDHDTMELIKSDGFIKQDDSVFVKNKFLCKLNMII